MDIEFFLAILSVGLGLTILVFSGASYATSKFEEEVLEIPFATAVVEIILNIDLLGDSEELEDSKEVELVALIEAMRQAFANDLGVDERYVYVTSVLLGSLIVTFEVVTPDVVTAENVVLSAEETLDQDESEIVKVLSENLSGFSEVVQILEDSDSLFDSDSDVSKARTTTPIRKTIHVFTFPPTPAAKVPVEDRLPRIEPLVNVAFVDHWFLADRLN
jgi:hypothetical protein